MFRERERERRQREKQREGFCSSVGESDMAAAAAADKPGNEHSFSPVHIYQEVVGYAEPKNEKGRAGNGHACTDELQIPGKGLSLIV